MDVKHNFAIQPAAGNTQVKFDDTFNSEWRGQFSLKWGKDYAKTWSNCDRDENLARKYLLSVSMMRLTVIPPMIKTLECVNGHGNVGFSLLSRTARIDKRGVKE